jgi:putative oxidoreductase
VWQKGRKWLAVLAAKAVVPPPIESVPCSATIIVTESRDGASMSFSETISPMLGRWALAWFYGSAALDILEHWSGTVTELSSKHLPIAPLLLVVALVMILCGVISLLFGYHTRYGAVILFGITVSAAFALHDYWHYADANARNAEFEIFTRDIAICGGLLLMIGLGGGPFAIDNRSMGGGRGRR